MRDQWHWYSLSAMQIHVWSDVVCPWCYIGTTNLLKALGDTEATVVFRAFQLDPAAPDVPMLSVEYLTQRYGPQATAMMDNVTEVAARAGLQYHLERSWSGQTRDAHRLLHLGLAHGLQMDLAQRFFAAQFTQGRSLFDSESLIELCAEAGLDPAEASRVLASDKYDQAVDRDIAQARAYGITSVPFFVFDERLAVSGAQPPEVFARALARAATG